MSTRASPGPGSGTRIVSRVTSAFLERTTAALTLWTMKQAQLLWNADCWHNLQVAGTAGGGAALGRPRRRGVVVSVDAGMAFAASRLLTSAAEGLVAAVPSGN